MKKNDRAKIGFSEDFILESAEKRFESGDYLGALTMLNKRAENYGPSADSSALYADVYEALGLYPLCADAWFRFLDTCNEADFSEGYEGLSIAFLNMGDNFQSELYFHRAFEDEEFPFETPEEPPKLRLVHSDDGSVENAELLRGGIESIRAGELEKAQEIFAEIPPESADYPSASGLSAMCSLLLGDIDGAADECEKLIRYHPENVHALTTYCAVLSAKGDAKGAKEIGRRLAALDVEAPDDLFRVASALCETGLDEEAFEKLSLLKEKVPYGDDVLWMHAVAAYRTGRREEAIASLERLTTVYPRKVVAKRYLFAMREEADGGAPVPIGYFYKLPDAECKRISSLLKNVASLSDGEAQNLADVPELIEDMRLAFDQLDGRDDGMQSLAVDAALKSRCDDFLREILLDYNVGDDVKLSVLKALVLRNEENSFGVVVCSLYREFFLHEVKFGKGRNAAFSEAFAEVYSKYALLGEECENKIIDAAEDVYAALEDAEALRLAEDKAALSAAIYREARLKQEIHSLENVAKLFDADLPSVKEILDYII